MAGLESKTYNALEKAPFKIEMASSGRSKCRNPSCKGEKKSIKKGELRMARMEPSPTDILSDRLYGKLMPKWVHMRCCASVILQEAVDRYGGTIEGVPGYDDLEPSVICLEPKAEALALTQSILGLTSGSERGTANSSSSKNNDEAMVVGKAKEATAAPKKKKKKAPKKKKKAPAKKSRSGAAEQKAGKYDIYLPMREAST